MAKRKPTKAELEEMNARVERDERVGLQLHERETCRPGSYGVMR
jgi:hypothetical protein